MSDAVASPADDRCPRCGGAFRCGMNAPAPCACSAVMLDAATLARLRQRYSGCLCLGCLRVLATAEPAGPAVLAARWG
jgi:hypothetical protein